MPFMTSWARLCEYNSAIEAMIPCMSPPFGDESMLSVLETRRAPASWTAWVISMSSARDRARRSSLCTMT